jgi:hypothetical protein
MADRLVRLKVCASLWELWLEMSRQDFQLVQKKARSLDQKKVSSWESLSDDV